MKTFAIGHSTQNKDYKQKPIKINITVNTESLSNQNICLPITVLKKH